MANGMTMFNLLENVHLTNARHSFVWSLKNWGKFSTGSLYFQRAGGFEGMNMWKARLLGKINVFLWQLARGRLRNGDQVAKNARFMVKKRREH